MATRTPPPRYPNAIERDYRRTLLSLVKQFTASVKVATAQAINRFGPDLDARVRHDALTDDLLNGVTMAQSGFTFIGIDRARLTRFGLQIAAFANTDTARQVTALEAGASFEGLASSIRLSIVAPVPKALMDTWVDTNLALVRSIPARHLAQVRESVIQAVSEGRSSVWLSGEIERRAAVTASRARLIARNEIGNLYSDVTRQRQMALGISQYRWSTSQDERVRSEHEALNGRIFSWPDGDAVEGNPGQPFNCRCVAIPVLPST